MQGSSLWRCLDAGQHKRTWTGPRQQPPEHVQYHPLHNQQLSLVATERGTEILQSPVRARSTQKFPGTGNGGRYVFPAGSLLPSVPLTTANNSMGSYCFSWRFSVRDKYFPLYEWSDEHINVV